MLGAQMTEYAGWILPLQYSSNAASLAGTYSPTLSTGIATTYLPAGLAGIGTKLDLAARNNVVSVEVT